MSDIELIVKPILEELGLFNGKEVSVKETFEKYLKICPHGVGPLGVFKKIVAYKLNLADKETRVDGKVTDYLFIYEYKNDIRYYDPRVS
jgi:hypothetical protein